MALHEFRCPKCGKLLAEYVETWTGKLIIVCIRCKERVEHPPRAS